eukprot:1312139-Amphidinium_carterae.2
MSSSSYNSTIERGRPKRSVAWRKLLCVIMARTMRICSQQLGSFSSPHPVKTFMGSWATLIP